jgi:DNA-binding NtrC family response regulator
LGVNPPVEHGSDGKARENAALAAVDQFRVLPLRVLLVGHNPDTLTAFSNLLARHGHETIQANSLTSAGARLSQAIPDIVVVDVDGADVSTAGLFADFRNRFRDIALVVVLGGDSAEQAARYTKLGADQILSKPVSPWSLELAVAKLGEVRQLRQRVFALERELTFSVREAAFPDIVTNSDSMKAVLRLVEKVSTRDLSVLICGESGTGKELVARAIHQASQRCHGNFVELNCAALPPNLVESELFGHEKGAFTGAIASRAGKVELASGGTLFLDEIGELPIEIQPKLLRALQERRITRIGGHHSIDCDFRLVCATNRDLITEVRAGRFREDLFYRVAVFPVQLPPLRERMEDLELLLEHFLRQEGSGETQITPAALNALRKYLWPGNIRELKNFIQAVLLLMDHGTIDDLMVTKYFGSRMGVNASQDLNAIAASQSQPRSVRRLLELQHEEIMYAVQVYRGNIPEAARALGMGRATLYKYLNRAVTQADE